MRLTKKHLALLLTSCILYLSCISQIGRDTTINLYFATNSADLDSSQHKALQTLATNFHISSIKGYADTTGTRKYNLSLSQKRVLSVVTALNNQDPISKVSLLYLGETADSPGLWQNRRVQIIANSITERDVISQMPIRGPANDTAMHVSAVVRDLNLDYIYFFPDKAVVTSESLPYMQQLAKILKAYKTETFEIIGHINYQSRFDSTHLRDLYQLSERRAKTIYDFLIEQGIPANRMTYKGVGNSQPVYPKPANEEEKRKNMRVQIVIRK